MMLIGGKPFAQTAVAISGIDEFESEVNDPPIKIALNGVDAPVRPLAREFNLILKLHTAYTINSCQVQAENFKPPADRESGRDGTKMPRGRKGNAIDRVARRVVIPNVDKPDFLARRQSHETDVKLSCVVVLEAGLFPQDLKRVHRGSALGSVGTLPASRRSTLSELVLSAAKFRRFA